MRSTPHEERLREAFNLDDDQGMVLPAESTDPQHGALRLATVARVAAIRLHQYFREQSARGKSRFVVGVSFGTTCERIVAELQSIMARVGRGTDSGMLRSSR
jgi:DNA-binding transcriptional regulator LsrR (DeoR family)